MRASNMKLIIKLIKLIKLIDYGTYKFFPEKLKTHNLLSRCE